PERDVDELSFTGPLPVAKGSEHGKRAVEAGRGVPVGNSDVHRRPALVPRDRGETGQWDGRGPVRNEVAVGSGPAVTGDRHHDGLVFDTPVLVDAERHAIPFG